MLIDFFNVALHEQSTMILFGFAIGERRIYYTMHFGSAVGIVVSDH